VAQAYPGSEPSENAIEAVREFERETGGGLYYLAGLYDWAGSEADAIRVVEDGVAARNPWQGMAAVFVQYDGLRENPRYQEILRELGLPNGSMAYRAGLSDGGRGSD
jgi:hypothetical protein